MNKGIVEWFDSYKGIGEITSEHGRFWVDVRELTGLSFSGKFKTLKQGQIVEFEERPSKYGSRVAHSVNVVKEEQV